MHRYSPASKSVLTYQPKSPSTESARKSEQPLLLESSWSFWLDKYPGPNLSPEEYITALTKLGTVATIQDFWRWQNNLPSPFDIGFRTRYHVMKAGIQPVWEDKANMNGGCIAIRVPKQELEYAWMRVLLGVVGEQFSLLLEEIDAVCGISVSIRKSQGLISIWNKNTQALNFHRVREYIAKRLLAQVNIQDISYKAHKADTSKTTTNEEETA